MSDTTYQPTDPSQPYAHHLYYVLSGRCLFVMLWSSLSLSAFVYDRYAVQTTEPPMYMISLHEVWPIDIVCIYHYTPLENT